MSQVIGQVWREVVGCRNWPVMRVPQFIALRRNGRLVMTLPDVFYALQWRHNEPDCVSNHQPHDCLLNRLFRHRSKKHQSSASLAFVRGIHRGTVNFPHKGSVTRKMFPFDDVIMEYHVKTDVQRNSSPMLISLPKALKQTPLGHDVTNHYNSLMQLVQGPLCCYHFYVVLYNYGRWITIALFLWTQCGAQNWEQFDVLCVRKEILEKWKNGFTSFPSPIDLAWIVFTCELHSLSETERNNCSNHCIQTAMFSPIELEIILQSLTVYIPRLMRTFRIMLCLLSLHV